MKMVGYQFLSSSPKYPKKAAAFAPEAKPSSEINRSAVSSLSVPRDKFPRDCVFHHCFEVPPRDAGALRIQLFLDSKSEKPDQPKHERHFGIEGHSRVRKTWTARTPPAEAARKDCRSADSRRRPQSSGQMISARPLYRTSHASHARAQTELEQRG